MSVAVGGEQPGLPDGVRLGRDQSAFELKGESLERGAERQIGFRAAPGRHVRAESGGHGVTS